MKKTITLVLATFMVVSGSAQLYVKNNGRVSISTNYTTSAAFSIKGPQTSSSNNFDGPPYNAQIFATRHGALSLDTDTATCRDAWTSLRLNFISAYSTPV